MVYVLQCNGQACDVCISTPCYIRVVELLAGAILKIRIAERETAICFFVSFT